MIEFLDGLDTELFLMLNGHNTVFFDRFMSLFTGRFVWAPMYATILYILFKTFTLRNALIFIFGILLAIVLADQVCASVIRPLVGRLRPSNPDNPLSEFATIVNGYRGGRFGFPSCHAANSFALMTFMAVLVRRFRFTVFALGWALTNCFTRLYLGVHYPGDLLVGAIIGSAIGLGCYAMASALSGSRMSVSERDSRTHLFVVPVPMGSVVSLRTIHFRVDDVLIASGLFTALILIMQSI